MKSFKQIYKIKASVNKVFDALTNPVTIEKWSGSPAEMDNKKGVTLIYGMDSLQELTLKSFKIKISSKLVWRKLGVTICCDF
ncbi:MAG: SRPBCC domain-containing protein [Ignavibacteria bacterium]|nr:SRPBCC domain-containing protein [Ignavibacteria bacterium]